MPEQPRTTEQQLKPSVEMISEDEPKGWLAKEHYTRSQAKQWAVGELGIEWIDVRVSTTYIRGLFPEEIAEGCEWGGMGVPKDHQCAVAFWEVRDRRV